VIGGGGNRKSNQHGKFPHVEDFALTRETLLEIATSDCVLHNALVAVGPAIYNDSAVYPTDDDVADLRDSLCIAPPNGSDNGSHDVLYLKVEDHDKTRAADLANAILEHLQNRTQEIHSEKARDVVDELKQKALIATADLKEATEQLTTIEKSVGSDLAELRRLHESPSHESDLHRKMIDVEAELRATRQKAVEFTQLREVLTTTQQDPHHLVSMPNGLLKSQPTLRRLKDGLSDAQSKLRQAQAAENDVIQHINAELAIAILGIEVEERVNGSHIDSIESQNDDLHGRLERLAELRSEYSTLIDRVDHHTELVRDARRSLTDARAMLASANKTQLIRPLVEPKAGVAMIGQSRAFVVLSGLVGGMVLGWGLLFVALSPATPQVPPSNQESRQSRQNNTELSEAEVKVNGNALALPSYTHAAATDGRL
jgi:uncharacterized protein involved in exopolysaccharide biosynthesis